LAPVSTRHPDAGRNSSAGWQPESSSPARALSELEYRFLIRAGDVVDEKVLRAEWLKFNAP
jgi:hypothetical protein